VKPVQATGTATLRYWAAAREAAGTSEEQTRADTLGAALSAAVAERGAEGDRLARVLQRCSFLVDGQQVGKRDPQTVRLDPGAVVEILPPFAGG
jgi:molybdopterin converting factor small subunit